MLLVQQCGENPDLEHQLREVLNMSRDSDKWRNFTRVLQDKVRGGTVLLWLYCFLWGVVVLLSVGSSCTAFCGE
jgi:acetone carboxylase gamma subunit